MPYHSFNYQNPFAMHKDGAMASHGHHNYNHYQAVQHRSTLSLSSLAVNARRLDDKAFDKDAAWMDYATSAAAGESGDFKCYAERQLHRVDTAWLLISSMRVLSMQVAFGLFEAGCTRPCHVSTVVLKNVGDLLIGGIAYWLIGYGISFGNADDGVDGSIQEDSSTWTFASGPFFQRVLFADKRADNAVWLFQMSFACTATTIVSGMIAERGTLRAYLLLAFIITGVVYPVVAHWVWGGGLLAGMSGGQYTDFAGSSVVHMVGAFAGLSYCFAIGPRIGRFENVNMFAKARQGLRRTRDSNGNFVDGAGGSSADLLSIENDNNSSSSNNNNGNCLTKMFSKSKNPLKLLENENDSSSGSNPANIKYGRRFSVFHYLPTEKNGHDGHDVATSIGHRMRRFFRNLRYTCGLKSQDNEGHGVNLRGMLMSNKMLELSRCMLKQRALDTAQQKRGLIYKTSSSSGGSLSNANPGKDMPNIDNTKAQEKENNTNTNDQNNDTNTATATLNDPNDTIKRGPVEVDELDRIIRGEPKQKLDKDGNPTKASTNQINVHARAGVIWGVRTSMTGLSTADKSGTLKLSGTHYTKGQEVVSNSEDSLHMDGVNKLINKGGEKDKKGLKPMSVEQEVAALKKASSENLKKDSNINKPVSITQAVSKLNDKNESIKTNSKSGGETVTQVDTDYENTKHAAIVPAGNGAAKNGAKKTSSAGSTAQTDTNLSDIELVEDEKSLTYNDQYGAELQIKRMLLRAGCFLDQRSGLPSIILFEKSKASSPVNMLFGTMLLLIGWFGFNCGSTTSLLNDADFVAARVGVNTMFAAIGGGTVPYFWYVLLLDDERPTLVQSVCMGILSGLVSSCAGVHLYERWAAFLVGAIGWCAGEFCDRLLRNKFYIDDVVGGFAVHGAAGVWGTVAVALFASPDCTFHGEDWKPLGLWYGGDVEFLLWQMWGAFLIGTWAFTSTYFFLWVCDKFVVEIREDVISELLGAADAPKMVATLEVLCWGQLRELKMLKLKQKMIKDGTISDGQTKIDTAKLKTMIDNNDLHQNFDDNVLALKVHNEMMRRMSHSSLATNFKTQKNYKKPNKGPDDLLRNVEKSKLKFSQLNIDEQCILMRALNIRVNWSGGDMGGGAPDHLTSKASGPNVTAAGGDRDNQSNSLGAYQTDSIAMTNMGPPGSGANNFGPGPIGPGGNRSRDNSLSAHRNVNPIMSRTMDVDITSSNSGNIVNGSVIPTSTKSQLRKMNQKGPQNANSILSMDNHGGISSSNQITSGSENEMGQIQVGIAQSPDLQSGSLDLDGTLTLDVQAGADQALGGFGSQAGNNMLG